MTSDENKESIFTQYLLKRKELIKNRKALQTTYIPEALPHRKDQIDRIASIISIGLNGEKPSNIMIYGQTGTGKTAVINYIGRELKKIDPDNDRCFYLYINCEVVDTAYGILYNAANQFIKDSNRIPFTGWSFEKLYEEFYKEIESLERVFVIVLDEVDHMIARKGDDIFYYLAKINEHLNKSKVSLIGISNNMKFTELLEPKAKSRFGGENLIFHPYTAEELEDILEERAKEVFENENILEPSVIPYCASIAAKNEGDARMAIDLLRTAAEIAERNGDSTVTNAHVKSSKNSIEMDAIDEAVKSLTSQYKIVLRSIIQNTEEGNKTMITGDVYETYKNIATILNVSVLSQRRITGIISELDMLGLINAGIKSFGRGGRTKEIALGIPNDIVERFKADPFFKPLREYKGPPTQTKLI